MRRFATPKRWIYEFLRTGPVNFAMRAARPLIALLPMRVAEQLPAVGTVRFPLEGGRTLLLESDGTDAIASSMYWKGASSVEPETLSLYMRLVEELPPSPVVLDVGAYTGIFALLAASLRHDASVHAFEPVPATFRALKRNVARNRLANVSAVRAAVGESDGEAILYVPTGSGLPLSPSALRGFREPAVPLTVPLVRLDTYVERESLTRVDLIKLDTECTEPQVLEGARGILDRHRPLLVCEVLYGFTEDKLHEAFRGRDYRYYHITARGPIGMDRIEADRTYRERNFLFVPAERAADLPAPK